jgi:hypothetical protein
MFITSFVTAVLAKTNTRQATIALANGAADNPPAPAHEALPAIGLLDGDGRVDPSSV